MSEKEFIEIHSITITRYKEIIVSNTIGTYYNICTFLIGGKEATLNDIVRMLYDSNERVVGEYCTKTRTMNFFYFGERKR